MRFHSVSIKRFREEVDAIEDDFARILVKIGYLTAGRASELCTKTVPWELLKGASRPYGQFMSYALKDFELTPQEDPSLKNTIVEKALVITSAVAKRGKRIKKDNAQEKETEVTADAIKAALTKFNQKKVLTKWEKGEIEIDPRRIKALNSKMTFKAIALPIRMEYEPWTYDLLKHYDKHKKLTFDHTRQYFRQTFRRALKGLLPPKSPHTPKNLLRHYRLSHLMEYYQFDAVQLSNYSGWTIKTAFDKQGMNASSNIDFYIHQAWRQYFKKLLRPIDQLIK